MWRKQKMKSETGKVVSVNVSKEKGTVKESVDKIVIDENGIAGDAHAGPWHRQISILDAENISRFSEEIGREIEPGEFAENITIEGIDTSGASIMDRFAIGDAVLEVSQLGKKCHGAECAIFREIGKCVMPHKGIFTRVVKGGAVKAGDTVTMMPREFRFDIITVSDRASKGLYKDRSGPRCKELIEEFFKDKSRQIVFESAVLPDEPEKLKERLLRDVQRQVDAVITTGGTGVGPRDITPDVVMSLADKTIPGIMEHIRLKYGREKPNALLSRGVAAVKGKTLIYTLPGSVKAVQEYTPEILETLEHLIYVLGGLDTH